MALTRIVPFGLRGGVSCGILRRLPPSSSQWRPVSKYNTQLEMTPREKQQLEETKAELLARTKVVTCPEESAEVVQRLLSARQPVGLDLELIHANPVGLLQVRDADGRVYLFRTAFAPDLVDRGGLRDLLEDPGVVKVMHAACGDAAALYRMGVKLWGLHDVALAFKVIQHAAQGVPLSQNTTSFNGVCHHFGLPANPLKGLAKRRMAQQQFDDGKGPTIDETLALYSAFDVDPLLELYRLTKQQLDEDLVPLFREMCDCELLRSVNPTLVRARQSARIKNAASNVYVSGLPAGVRKPGLFELTAANDGFVDLYYAPTFGSANFLFSDRACAVAAFKDFSKRKLPKEFGENVKFSLMQPLSIREMEDEQQMQQAFVKEASSDVNLSPAACGKVVGKLLEAGVPVLIECSMTSCVVLTIFAAKHPKLKVMVFPDSVQPSRIGELVASPDVVKIFSLVATGTVSNFLKLCAAHGHTPRNVFDLATAHKAVAYWQQGHSFGTVGMGIKDMLATYGLVSNDRLENLYLLYLWQRKCLPPEILDIVKTKSQIDVDLMAQVNLASTKQLKVRFHQKTEAAVAFVTCEKGPAGRLKKVIEEHLVRASLPYERVTVIEDNKAFVEVTYRGDIHLLLKTLDAQVIGGLHLKASPIEVKSVVDNSRTFVDLVVVSLQMTSLQGQLNGVGFNEVLQSASENDSKLSERSEPKNAGQTTPTLKNIVLTPPPSKSKQPK